MPGSRVLILFSTSYGHTGQVAERLAWQLRQRGHDPDLRRVEQLPPDFSLEPYRAVLLGGAVYFNRFAKPLRAFATEHHRELARLPGAFFSVGFSGGSRRIADREHARHDFERFARETGWRPSETGFFGGAVEYTRYGRTLRWFTWIFGRWQGAGDRHRDYDLTDWSEVDRFADRFADLLEAPRPAFTPPLVMPGKPPEHRPRG